MKNPGYVYVLINPAMEGLVKIGRTERDPHERAKELSVATGVPTPFFVAYDSFFEDCVGAEQFIHATLELKGYRLTNNKEFFNCPPNEAIKTVVEAQTYIASIQSNEEQRQNENDVTPTQRLMEPWKESLELALAYYSGEGDFLQDYEKAIKYFKQAVKLGSVEACVYLGNMYRNCLGVAKNLNEALMFYEEGTRKGDITCLAYMAMAYYELEHFENSNKCWQKYFESEEFQQDLSGRRAEIAWESYKYDTLSLDSSSWSIDDYMHSLGNKVFRDMNFYKIKGEVVSYGDNIVGYVQREQPFGPLKEEFEKRLSTLKDSLKQKWNITIIEFDTKGFKGMWRLGSLIKVVGELMDDMDEAKQLLTEFPASFEIKIPEDQINAVVSRLESTGAKIKIEKI